ncbi:hypothetical protein LTS18_002461, partial [Coniosporium uncinatum]
MPVLSPTQMNNLPSIPELSCDDISVDLSRISSKYEDFTYPRPTTEQVERAFEEAFTLWRRWSFKEEERLRFENQIKRT